MGDKKNRYNHIETGAGSPQISVRVWRSPGWRDFSWAFPLSVGGFFLFVGMVALSNPRDAKMAPLLFLVALLFFFTIFPFRMLGKSEYRLGFDLKNDTLWVFRKGRGLVSVEPDAHKITGFSFIDKKSFTLNTIWYVNPTMPFLWRKKEWLLMVNRTGSDFPFGVGGSGLAQKKEAQEVVEKANMLLKSVIKDLDRKGR